MISNNQPLITDSDRLHFMVHNGQYTISGNPETGYAVLDTSNGLTFVCRDHTCYTSAIDETMKKHQLKEEKIIRIKTSRFTLFGIEEEFTITDSVVWETKKFKDRELFAKLKSIVGHQALNKECERLMGEL